jgi:glutamyl-tRNA(Gln) amidotransferase subunit D
VEHGVITMREPYRKKTPGTVSVEKEMDEDVAIVYFYPGMKPEDIPKKKGLILVGTGLGHVNTQIIPMIQKMIQDGTTVVMTSQCLFGRVNMRVYSAGRDLIKAGVISGEDMLPETAYVKLMWALAHGTTKKEREILMTTPIAGEISLRTKTDTFF